MEQPGLSSPFMESVGIAGGSMAAVPWCYPNITLSLSFFFLNFIFNIVYITERDVCPCGPLPRVGRVKYGGPWVVSVFFSPLLSTVEEGEKAVAWCQAGVSSWVW